MVRIRRVFLNRPQRLPGLCGSVSTAFPASLIRMKAITLAVVLWATVQALPATLQIYPPTDAPAAIRVEGAGNLQEALDRAKPGDVIELAAGATYTGNFVLTQKTGDRYITLRTAASSGLPDATGRIGPEHAAKLAKIQSPNSAPAIRTAPGAHHWRLMLLEIGPAASPSADLLVLGDASAAQANGATPRHLIVDRCYIHGDSERGQKRGIALNSASTTVSGSYIAEIKSPSQDAQAIAGWNGPGPFLIENNYLEASGENFMLGGAIPATAGLVPSDVVFRRNHVTRPPAWRTEQWAVKNLFELKNARRVLVEGNLFEHNWVDAQPGYAIVITPRGERGAASWATVEDVTFRYNIVRNVAAVFNLLARDDAGPSGTTRRMRIADNVIHSLDREKWGGNGVFLQIGQGPQDIVVEHNTILNSGNVISAYGGSREEPATAVGFVFRNNITVHNSNGVIGQGRAIGNETLSAYFPGAIFARNVLAGGSPSRYPGDNLFPDADRFAQQFVNYQARDYRLRQGSDFRRAGTDGLDLGANFVTLARTIGSRAREWLGLPSTAAF